jgi:N-acetyl-anhydromuramyl-L-alanine amidase AmpD
VTRSVRVGAAILVIALMAAGCGDRGPGRVPTLRDAGLAAASDEALARCAQRLGLPDELPRPADSTNFGVRQRRDDSGREVPHRPRLIVLHETVMSAEATLNYFATPHPRDEDQASYHLLVDRQGRRLRIAEDGARAYGAGMSAFGDFTVRIRPDAVGSINNVALHLGLESPPDGRGDAAAHSGYTPQQYRTAAAQVLLWQARFGIPLSRLTTHAAVDRSRSRYDPRSFRWDRFEAPYREAAQRCGFTAYDTGQAAP